MFIVHVLYILTFVSFSTILTQKSTTEIQSLLLSMTSFSSSVFPAIALGFINLSEIFAYVTVWFFLNPTIEVVTFRLRGWCVFVAGIHPSRTSVSESFEFM